MHRSTNTTSFSLVLSRQPPGPTNFDTPSALSTDAYHETHPQVLQTQLLNRVQGLRSRVDDCLKAAQGRYKQDYDSKVSQIQTITPGQMVFIDRPPLLATPARSAVKMAQSSYNKLIPRTLGPFQVVSVTPHTLTIDENGIHKQVKIDWASAAPNRFEWYCTMQHQTAGNSPATSIQGTDGSNPKSPKEYAIDRILGHTENGANIRYRVR